MVYVNGLKYACGACIKGHRSSSCSHTDRPLFEIKKKGRPVTQCEHCRQLRKTKQVHVKCSCGGSSEDALKETRGKAKRKIPTLAAFPDGLEPHRATPSPATKAPSSSSCGCKSTGRCSCSTPILKKSKPIESSSSSSSSSAPPSAPITPPPISCCSGKKNPKPTYDLPPPIPLPLQPDIGVDIGFDVGIATYVAPSDLMQPTPRTYASTSYPTPDMTHPPVSTPFSWPSGSGVGSCSCGVTCACPGCIDHADLSTALMSSESCPYACTACVHCNGFGFAPLPAPGPTDLTARTLTSTSGTLDMLTSSPTLPVLKSASACASASELAGGMVSDCCGGACKCSTQYLSCQCTSDCCGCCFGCECSESEEEEEERAMLGFAVSGERGSCCSEPRVKGGGEGENEDMEGRKKKRRVDA